MPIDLCRPRTRPRAYYHLASAFHQKHGHLRVPRTYNEKLYHWLAAKRHRFNKGLLDDRTFTFLSAIGMDWNPPVPIYWLTQLEQLQKFLLKYGHAPGGLVTTPLSKWLTRQKEKYLKGQLSPRQIEMMAAVTLLPADKATERLRRLTGRVLTYVQDGNRIDSNCSVYNDYLFIRNAFKTGHLPGELISALQSANVDLTTKRRQRN